MSELELTLAVDSSVRADARLALVAQGGRVVESRAQLSGMVALASAASELVSAAAGHLSQVVVARGPGSYIGVRAGMAMALGIAQGRGLPIHQVGSLEVVAATARTQPQDILVLVEAGRGGLYGQRFRANLGRAGERGWLPASASYALGRDASWPAAWDGVQQVLSSPGSGVAPGLTPVSPGLSMMEALAELAGGDLGPASGYDQLRADYGRRIEEPS